MRAIVMDDSRVVRMMLRRTLEQLTFEVTDPTVDSQLASLKGAGADTFINISTPKFAAQSIRKVGEMGWKPTQYLVSVSTSVRVRQNTRAPPGASMSSTRPSAAGLCWRGTM